MHLKVFHLNFVQSPKVNRNQPTMDRNKLVTIKFKHRNATNTCDKRIADAYTKGSKFDVDLVTGDDKLVSAHRFVLAMFSKYLANKMGTAGTDGVIVGELFYCTFLSV